MRIEFDSAYSQAYRVTAVEVPTGAEAVTRLFFPGAVETGGKDGVTLKVTPRGGEPWIGTFAFGYESPRALTSVLGCPNEQMLCVVSKGQGYTVMANDPYQWNLLAPFPITQACPIPSKRLIVLADLTTLTAYRDHILIWRTARLSWDGISITDLAHGSLKGRGWDAPDQKEVEFIVDLDTGSAQV